MKKLITFFILSVFCAGNVLADDAQIKELEAELTSSTLKRSDWENTIIIADEIIKYIPNHPEAHFEKGWAFLHLGRYQDAVDSLQLAIKSDYASKGIYSMGELYYELAQAFEGLDQLEEALYYYEKGIENGIDHRYIYFSRNGVLVKLSRDID